MNAVDVHHATFVIERKLRTKPERAFRYWSDPALKERWTACHPDWRVVEDAFDFRVGGGEARRWRMADGRDQTFTAHYLDIVPAARIVYAFEMSIWGERVSASLATVVLRPYPEGTAMQYTEQIAFFGSRAGLETRIAGTGDGFDRLEEVFPEGAGTG